jgi:hypothetical protein
MAYPEKGAKYAGEDRVAQVCRADGGSVKESEGVRAINDALQRSADGLAKGLRSPPSPYRDVQPNADMQQAEDISDAVPRRKE